MPSSRPVGPDRPARGGLRSRMLLAFLVPVLLLGLGGLLLIGLPGDTLAPHSTARAGIVFLGLLAAALLLATGLAVHMGDRVARPVAWLLRLMDAGQIRLLTKGPPPAGDWEVADLSRRVQVLLKQNLSGAEAMEELEALRREIAAVLDAAVVGRLDPLAWPRARATHPQTRRLLDFFRVRAESLRDAAQGLARLEKLLQQDWRRESSAVREIAERSERCFLGQTEMALELERLERLVRPSPAEEQARADAVQALVDLRASFARWREQAEAAIEGAAGATASAAPRNEGAAAGDAGDGGDAARAGGGADAARAGEGPAVAGLPPERRLSRMREWAAWVEESLAMLAASASEEGAASRATSQRLAGGLERIARSAADAGQELGALSREAARLQRAWEPLGERLRSLLVRVAEVETCPGGARSAGLDGAGAGRPTRDADEGESRDAEA